ncbi:MAG TPA: type IV pilus modification protein PilV [Gammaproteobacteria bacterium]
MKDKTHHVSIGRHTSGFTLIEVLVALVVLSVGLLGIAGMISVSLKSSGSTYTRTQVTALTYNILDRMRANRGAAQAGDYNLALTDSVDSTYKDKCLASSSNASTVNCNTTDIAKFDLYEWRQDLANELPSGTGSISTTTIGKITQVTITVEWSDARAQQALGETTSTNPAPSSLSITSAL